MSVCARPFSVGKNYVFFLLFFSRLSVVSAITDIKCKKGDKYKFDNDEVLNLLHY